MRAAHLFDLNGKVALVSGGGDGIGRALATAMAEAGAHVVVFSRRLEACEESAREIEAFGVRALAIQCDITRQADVDRMLDQTLKEFQKIDILVNNSGRTWGAAPEDMRFEDWHKVIDLNVNATFRCTQKVGIEMIRQKSGRIINISSYAGFGGTDPAYLNAIAYNTSKGAIHAFTKDLAVKWAPHNITVNAIAPGWFPTKMTRWVFEHKGEDILARIPMHRYGEMTDIKGAVIFLASRASDYVTGQIISVDGGLSAW